jgi:hypothetical protein
VNETTKQSAQQPNKESNASPGSAFLEWFNKSQWAGAGKHARELAEAAWNASRKDADTAYKRLHSQVSGYLHGEDWEHWQKYNDPRYSPNAPGERNQEKQNE